MREISQRSRRKQNVAFWLRGSGGTAGVLYPIERGNWDNWFDATINRVNSRRCPKNRPARIGSNRRRGRSSDQFPEVMNRVCFLPDPSAAISVIDPTRVEFCREKRRTFLRSSSHVLGQTFNWLFDIIKTSRFCRFLMSSGITVSWLVAKFNSTNAVHEPISKTEPRVEWRVNYANASLTGKEQLPR